MDGLVLNTLCCELNTKLAQAKIDRISQPDATTLVFDLRQQRVNLRLVISAHPRFARLHLSERKRLNPPVPPTFCQYLRRLLEGTRIESVSQSGYERLVSIHLQGRDELGNPAYYCLNAELMGRNSNIILVNADGRILDAMKHSGYNQIQQREILPGADYSPPKRQDKIFPELWQAPRDISVLPDGDLDLSTWLNQSLEGISLPSILALLDICRLPHSLKAKYLRLEDWLLLQASLYDLLQSRVPGRLYLYTSGKQAEVAAFPLPGSQEGVWMDASIVIDTLYANREEAEALQQQRHRLKSVLRAAEEKGKRKRFALEEDLSNAQGSDHLRIWGELLKMAPEPHRRLSGIELVNYYSEDLSPLLIPLDQRLTVAENAQSYFKRYSKFRIGERYISDQLTSLNNELSYLAGVMVAVEQAQDLTDLKEIAVEMVEQGYLPPEAPSRHKGKPKTNETPHPPLSFTIEGIEVLVGRNNRQNEELTWRLARSDDLWLHTREIPGSHLLIRASDPANSVLEKAARLAAWFSQARESGLVPVDITLRRHLKKPRGTRPGFVIYSNQRTVYINPASPGEVTDLLQQ